MAQAIAANLEEVRTSKTAINWPELAKTTLQVVDFSGNKLYDL